MNALVEIGGGEFSFCAAHTGLHEDGFEPLHGHTFTVTLRLAGPVDARGMVADFGPLKAALRRAIAPLRRRTLIATAVSEAPVTVDGQRVRFGDVDKHYDLPAGDVALLPLANTTTEAIAEHLLSQVCVGVAGLDWIELTLAEAPDVAVTIRRTLS